MVTASNLRKESHGHNKIDVIEVLTIRSDKITLY